VQQQAARQAVIIAEMIRIQLVLIGPYDRMFGPNLGPRVGKNFGVIKASLQMREGMYRQTDGRTNVCMDRQTGTTHMRVNRWTDGQAMD
jgi:hypothetical protein